MKFFNILRQKKSQNFGKKPLLALVVAGFMQSFALEVFADGNSAINHTVTSSPAPLSDVDSIITDKIKTQPIKPQSEFGDANNQKSIDTQQGGTKDASSQPNDDRSKSFDDESQKSKKNSQSLSPKPKDQKPTTKLDYQRSDSQIFKIKLSNRFVSEVNIVDNYETLNRQDKFIDSQFGARLYSSLYLAKDLELYGFVRMSRLDNDHTINQRRSSIDGGGNRNFENLGVFLPELNLRKRFKNNLLVLGKFTPDFGNGWRFDRGIWIQGIPGQYKQNEKLGIANIYSIGDAKKTGLYNLAVSFFRNDRGWLDDSLFAKRNQDTKEMARAGDTGSLQSFNLSANVNFDFGPDEKLSYHFSYLDLAVNKNATSVPRSKLASQKGVAYGLSYKLPIQDFLKLYNIVEYVEMRNIDGNSDFENIYLTTSVGAKLFNRWTMVIGNANRRTKNVSASGFKEEIREISFGYDCPKTEFFDRLTAQVGYQKMRFDHKSYADNRHGIGLLVRYYKNF